MLLHVIDTVANGIKKVVIRTVDTDVKVLVGASFSNIHPDELWIALGTGSRFRYIPVHQLVAAMNPIQFDTLSIFHALTRCDTVSYFVGGGKKHAYEIWKVFPAVTDAFEECLRMLSDVSEDEHCNRNTCLLHHNNIQYLYSAL